MNYVLKEKFRQMKLSYVQVPGRLHRERDEPCGDIIVVQSHPEYLFCGIADGKSGAEFGAEGGRASLEAVAAYIHALGIGNLIHAPFPDELPCMMVKEIRKRLLGLSREKKAELQSFASTLLAIAVDRSAGEYMLLHLGDGCALGIPETGDAAVLSPPENGLSFNHTWLTTSDCAVAHLHIRFGSLEGKTRILLLSDGASCLCGSGNIPRRAKPLLKDGSASQLRAYLKSSNPADDASCILLELHTLKKHLKDEI